MADSGRIELAVELPALSALAIDPAGLRIARIDADVEGQPRRQWTRQYKRVVLDLEGIEALVGDDAYPHASASIALVAGAPDRGAHMFSSRGRITPSSVSDKALIARQMKLDRARITHCYERVAQWRERPELQGTAQLEIFLGQSGRVEAVTTTSELPAAITTCIEEVVKAWQFPPFDIPIRVNYPLAFRTT